MNSKSELEKQVFMAAQENGISSVLFRNAMGRRLGLNIADVECFSLLLVKGISTPTELAHYTGLTTGSTTTMLDRLEKAGLIKRTPNPKDRRGVFIEVTEDSFEKVGPIVADVQKAHRELIDSYSEEELEVIIDFLTRFVKNVKEHTEIIEKGL